MFLETSLLALSNLFLEILLIICNVLIINSN